ncbi:trihelix transcription factor [Salix suchowensis]|nr:trihelix transcription factor [Salix suchowensis]
METSTTLPENSSAAAGDWEDEDGDEDMRVQAEEGVQCSTGNRWPKQETLALLKIRSDMDFAFRDSVVKAPLWEKVSRKLNELGYNRSAKKCKEKFENIYKYHRRTKGGQSGRPNGKTYRFFEQLQALDKTNALVSPASSDRAHCLMPSASVNPVSFIPNIAPCSIQSPSTNCTDATSTSTASTSSEESDGTRKKKQKLADFFERLMKEVVEKQENLQNKFLEAIEKCEQERIAREEAWKMQELDRIKREHELLVHERAISAAKDAAVLAFLQKFSDQGIPVQLPDNPTVPMKFPDNQTVPVQFSVSARLPKDQAVPVENAVKTHENNSLESFVNMSSSRWPKEEIESLIKIRTYLEFQCQENGPKGPLWEEISTSMKNLGYDRSAKRCKEKWENMNKYFKRVKESNKKRPGDSKTCPYFQQLDALYREKTRRVDNPGYELKPEELLMHMMGGQGDQQLPDSAMTEDRESENVDQIQEDYRSKEDGDGYRIVAIDPSSMEIME